MTISTTPGATAGGAAGQAGADFQNRVGAWLAVRILAEQSVHPPWGLPAAVTLDYLGAESEHPVDDLTVHTSAAGRVFVQAKHSLSLGSGSTAIAGTIDQFVRQYLRWQEAADTSPSGAAQPDLARHRLILAVGGAAPATIREGLAAMLSRVRGREPGGSLPSVMSAGERRAYDIVGDLVRGSWAAHHGGNPPDDDVHRLMDVMRVQPLEVSAERRDELDAKNVLRTAVLSDPVQDDAAWNTLVAVCAGYARTRTGGDRRALQGALLAAGIGIEAARSYRADVDRLRMYSRATLRDLEPHTRIRIGSMELRIERRSTGALLAEVERGSLLVVGEPGAGKSGALHDLVVRLQTDGRDAVILDAGAIEAQGPAGLRGYLGLDRDLADVLEGWPGLQPGVLVVDGLDAARGEQAAKALRNLIAGVLRRGGRWHVVASIRKFDLRYGQQLQELFGGRPGAVFRDADFPQVRHVNVPLLADDELELFAERSTELAQLLASADGVLLGLLRVPFNLRLAAELIALGLLPGGFSPIRTQLGLLERYWERRVVREGWEGGGREAVLRRVADAMVRTRRMRVERPLAVEVGEAQALGDLLSHQVLVEVRPSPTAAPARQILAFGHHVLFDYAVAALILGPREPSDLANWLADEPDLAVALRPSLTFHFQQTWEADTSRDHFWASVLGAVRVADVPEIGKLVGPAVAASSATRLEDLLPLADALHHPMPDAQDVAGRALRHLINAIIAAPNPSEALVGKGAGPWIAFSELLSQRPTPQIVAALRALLPHLYGHPDRCTGPQLDDLGRAARRLHTLAQSQEPRDGWLVTTTTKAVCRTFQSDPEASAALIRAALEPQHLANHGYEEMPKLAEEVGWLVGPAPGLVSDIYRAAIAYVETDGAATRMGGRILAFSSNRAQDYDMALYILWEAYPDFLARAPREAMGVVDTAVERYLEQTPSTRQAPRAISTFAFLGEQAALWYDRSEAWDGRPSSNYRDPNDSLDAITAQLARLAGEPDQADAMRGFLQAVVGEPRPASIWRRLLDAGAAYPGTLGRELRPLAWTMPILLGAATTAPAGAFLRGVFADLSAEERRRVEETILAIPMEVPTGRRQTGEQVRDRLLGHLPREALTTEEAKRFGAKLAEGAAGAAKASSSGRRHEDEIVRAPNGAWETAPEPEGLDHRVLALVRSRVEAVGAVVGVEQSAEVEAALVSLRDALSGAEATNVPTPRLREAWYRLAEACRIVAWTPGVACHDGLGVLVRTLLLAAVALPPAADEFGPDEYYDREHVLRPDGNPRAEAAPGLVWIASHPSCADRTLVDAIECLAEDPDPGVRLGVAAGANALAATAPDAMWRVLERFCRTEDRSGLLHFAVGCSLRRVARLAPARAATLAKTAFDRATAEGAEFVRRDCIGLFVDLYLQLDESVSRHALVALARESGSRPSEAGHIARELRLQGALATGVAGPTDPTQEAVRARAFSLLDRIVASAASAYAQLLRRVRENRTRPLTETEQRRFETLLEVGHSVGMEVYFASGAHAERHRSDSSEPSPLPSDVKRRFLDEAGPTLDALTGFGHPRIAHPLLQTLEAYVPLDPIGVFLRIARVVAVGREFGYQYEELAADLVVRLVERYLAEYREELRSNPECRVALVTTLDAFTEVGWPNALRLVYRLDQIYR